MTHLIGNEGKTFNVTTAAEYLVASDYILDSHILRRAKILINIAAGEYVFTESLPALGRNVFLKGPDVDFPKLPTPDPADPENKYLLNDYSGDEETDRAMLKSRWGAHFIFNLPDNAEAIEMAGADFFASDIYFESLTLDTSRNGLSTGGTLTDFTAEGSKIDGRWRGKGNFNIQRCCFDKFDSGVINFWGGSGYGEECVIIASKNHNELNQYGLANRFSESMFAYAKGYGGFNKHALSSYLKDCVLMFNGLDGAAGVGHGLTHLGGSLMIGNGDFGAKAWDGHYIKADKSRTYDNEGGIGYRSDTGGVISRNNTSSNEANPLFAKGGTFIPPLA